MDKINWRLITEIFFSFVLVFIFFGCEKDVPTTTMSGFVYDSSDVNNIKPLEDAKITVGHLTRGVGIPSGSDGNFHAFSDANGYYFLEFKASTNDFNSICQMTGYEGKPFPYYTDIMVGRNNKIDFYLFRNTSTLNLNFDKIPPFTDTLKVSINSLGSAFYIYPTQHGFLSSELQVPAGKYQKIRWEVYNGTKQEFVDSVFCPRGETIFYTIRY